MSAELKPTTVWNNFYVIQSCLQYAVRCRRLQANPAHGIALPSTKQPHVHEEERYPLTPDDVARICDALPAPWDTYTWLTAWTGMRPEEVSALTLRDVDLDQPTVHVRSVLVDVNGSLRREVDPKNVPSRRTITLDSVTADKLSEYIDAHQRRALRFFNAHPDIPHPGDGLPLFPGLRTGRANGTPDIDRLDFSKPMRHGNFYRKHWKRAVAAASLPANIRFYDLRHAHASLLVASIGKPGALNLKGIQERLGHASAVMTFDRYAHAGDRDTAKQRSALDSLAPAPEVSNVVPFNREQSDLG